MPHLSYEPKIGEKSAKLVEIWTVLHGWSILVTTSLRALKMYRSRYYTFESYL